MAGCDSTNKETDCLFMFENIENIKTLSTGMSHILITELSNTFPVLQFLTAVYKLDRNRNGDDITIQVREDFLVECWNNTAFHMIFINCWAKRWTKLKIICWTKLPEMQMVISQDVSPTFSAWSVFL